MSLNSKEEALIFLTHITNKLQEIARYSAEQGCADYAGTFYGIAGMLLKSQESTQVLFNFIQAQCIILLSEENRRQKE